MSVFNIDEKITFNSWDDVVQRPCFESPVEPQKNRFVRIAAVYSFKDQRACCGMSDCLKSHRRGFLVVTSDDKEANLCETCGRKLFDVSFEGQEKILQDQACIREQKIQINTVLEQVDNIKTRIKKLKQEPKGANWLYRILTNFRRTYPVDLLVALKELAMNKDDNAIIATLAENEADISKLEHVKQLQGLGIFAADIREELIGKILKPLKTIEELVDNYDVNTSLISQCKWADNLEEQFTCAELLVEEGRAFFDAENLERLKSIPLSEVSTRFVKSLNWDVNKAAKNK
ncbi:MAG: hypothetical protein L3K25_07440 [Gammaproteobacteria bacterium]|nr:hypothetical protein [Gammaproteobacteria bacterium]